MSRTAVLAPIVSALVKTEDMLGPDRKWSAVNAFQSAFLSEVFAKRAELSSFNPSELRSWVSKNAAELNAILKSEGFDIELDPFDDDGFGTVSILDVVVEWLKQGTESKVRLGVNEYPAVKLDHAFVDDAKGQSQPIFMVYKNSKHDHLIVNVNTKSGDRVYMTVAGTAVANDFALMNNVDALRSQLKWDGGEDYKSLTFPMVDLNQQVDIGWLKEMRTVDSIGVPWKVAQAKQQTKFKMNQFGARVKSAAAIGMKRLCMPKPPKVVVIDKPFLLWIERPGVTTPILYAYIDESDWKNPGDLAKI